MALSLRTTLAPGILLMRRLRLPMKLSIMGLALFVPLIVLLFTLLVKARADIEYTRSELQGARLVAALTDTAIGTAQMRGLNHRVLSGDTEAAAELKAARAAVLASLEKVDAQLAQTTAFDVGANWKPLREALAGLAQGQHDRNRDKAFAQHSAQIEAVRGQVHRVAESSGLLLDPHARTFFLMDIAVERMLPLLETLGQMRGLGSGLLARGDANGAERAALLGRVEQLRTGLGDLERRLLALERAGEARPAAHAEVVGTATAFADRVQAIFTAEAIEGEVAAYFKQGQAAVAALRTMEQQVGERLDAALIERVGSLQQALLLQASLSVVGLALLAYLGAAFYVSFTGAVRHLSRGMQAVADGDLAHKFQLQGRDEFAQIGTVVEGMSERLSSLVAEIRNSALRVRDTGETLAGGSSALAERTEEQAQSLREFVGAVEQMSAAAAGSATEVRELDEVTSGLHERAEAGNRTMGETIAALDALQASARRMSEIIGTIDGIAFQTNILALNAAVEAARAGESGRGFAVVASEVRQLAMRSSEAAQEIRRLIQTSREQVEGTVGRVQETGRALHEVVGGVRQTSERLKGFAASSEEQSQALHQMRATVGDLDNITRQNASMVDESRGAAAALVERSATLAEAVRSIRLRQGSADEARALVDRAQQQVRSQGLAGAAAALHSAEQGFVDRDLYVFVLDHGGTYVLHGAKPAMEGKRVHEVPGIDGDRFVRDIVATAAAGGGWVDYSIINPVSGQVQGKASWVEKLDERHIIGCGIYRNDTSRPAARAAAAAPAAPAAKAQSRSAGIATPSRPASPRAAAPAA